jgi:acetolactate synthase-1/2/3 large subunit
MTGAQIIVHLLERQGITWLPGIPGGSNLPLYDALSQSRILRHVLTRHEQGAGFMAQGMARATGRPAACLATSGPGATNLLTAVADAKADSVPLVAITGQVSQSLLGTDAFQEVDTFGMSMPVTKHNFLVRSAHELLSVLPRAFSIASSGRMGPVWVDVPKDVQQAVVEVGAWPTPGRAVEPPLPGEAALQACAELISQAQRPVLYIGGGSASPKAAAQVRALAELLGIPVASTLKALGAFPTDHPLSLGLFGMHGAPCANLAMADADLLIVLGARFDDRATGSLPCFCPKAKVVHIDIDASELGKLRRPHAELAADVAQALSALIPRLAGNTRPAWLAQVQRLKAEHPLQQQGRQSLDTAYGIIAACAAALPQARVATDVGQHQMWVAQAWPHRLPRHWLTSGGLGTMGFGLPAALGAALACPQDPVLCFSGDGSLMMNLQEMATAAEAGIPVKLVLMDNRSLGLVGQQQDLFYNGRRFACDYGEGPDWAGLARAMGWRAWDLEREPNPRAALRHALHSPGPALLRCPLRREAQVLPMVPPGAANTEMILEARHGLV